MLHPTWLTVVKLWAALFCWKMRRKENKGKKHRNIKSKKPLPCAKWPSREHDGNCSLNLGSWFLIPVKHLHGHHRRRFWMFGLNVATATVSVKQCGEEKGDVVVMETEVGGGWCWWWHGYVKGVWPAGRCPVIGGLVGWLSVRWAENWRRKRTRVFIKNDKKRVMMSACHTHLSLEKLTGGLFASFSWNRTLPVNLSHKVVEDLHTNTQTNTQTNTNVDNRF